MYLFSALFEVWQNSEYIFLHMKDLHDTVCEAKKMGVTIGADARFKLRVIFVYNCRFHRHYVNHLSWPLVFSWDIRKNEYTLHNVSMPISNPDVETGDETDGIIGYKKRNMSPKQGLAAVFQRIQSSRSNVDYNRPHCSM